MDWVSTFGRTPGDTGARSLKSRAKSGKGANSLASCQGSTRSHSCDYQAQPFQVHMILFVIGNAFGITKILQPWSRATRRSRILICFFSGTFVCCQQTTDTKSPSSALKLEIPRPAHADLFMINSGAIRRVGKLCCSDGNSELERIPFSAFLSGIVSHTRGSLESFQHPCPKIMH